LFGHSPAALARSASAKERNYSGARPLLPPAPLAQKNETIRALARCSRPLRSHGRRCR
jgi:hypothetical protein